MLDRSEIEKIYNTVHAYIRNVQKLGNKKEILQTLKTRLSDDFDFSALEKIKEVQTIVAEDGGLIVDTIGSLSYVFARAVALTKDDLLREDPLFVMLPSRILANVSIEDLATCLMKTLEYRAVYKLLNKHGDITGSVILFDGSLLADIFKLKFLSKEKKEIKEILNKYPELLLEHPAKIYQELFFEENLDPETVALALGLAYMTSLLRLFELMYNYRVYPLFFTKRPLSSKALLHVLEGRALGDDSLAKLSDLELLNLLFRDQPFVTRLLDYSLELPNEESKEFSAWLVSTIRETAEALSKVTNLDPKKIGDWLKDMFRYSEDYKKRFISIYLLYFRATPLGHIYKIEVPRISDLNKDKLREIIHGLILANQAYEGYPLELLLAHRIAHVPGSLKSYVESLIISMDKEHFIGGKDATRL